MFGASRRKKRKAEEAAAAARRRLTLLSVLYEDYAVNSTESGVEANRDTPLVVSLTTFGTRINDVHLCIESLFQQSVKADKVILWVSEADFSPADIPAVLKKQQRRGLEIAFCEQDLGPYTKFFYTLQRYPDCLMLTVDDDIIYPVDMVDQLYRAWRKEPQYIHCQRAHNMRLDDRGQILPYKQWDRFTTAVDASSRIFPTGVGGVLYFPGCFDDEVLNKEAFLRLSPNADDVWLKAMSLKNGVLCKRINDDRNWAHRFLVIEQSQRVALKRRNKSKKAGNDPKIKAVFEAYDLLGRLAP